MNVGSSSSGASSASGVGATATASATLNPPVTSYTGCLICDDCLNGMTELVAGRSMNLQGKGYCTVLYCSVHQ